MKIRFGIVVIYIMAAGLPSWAIAQRDNHQHKEDSLPQVEEQQDDFQGMDSHSEENEHQRHEDHQQDGHDHEGEHPEDENIVHLTDQQQVMAGIVVVPVVEQEDVGAVIYAPGEVVNNAYNTTIVTTQLDAKVLKRYVVLGQWVRDGDPLVKLFSQDMVAIQSQLRVAAKEWERVKKLGRKSVGSKRFVNAEVTFEKEKANALALGMSEAAVAEFLQDKSTLSLGQYILGAPYEGIIQSDDFQQGQLLSAGSPIVTVVDESQLWIEARLSPKLGRQIAAGSKADVVIRGRRFSATVIQENHAIEAVTRTRKVRLLIENKDHLLHPGFFADVYLTLQGKKSGVVLPDTALMRSSDGHWTVFIEQSPGEFKVQEVELINSFDNRHLVKGLYAGQRVVEQGAFFLASQQAKSGFDPHNH